MFKKIAINNGNGLKWVGMDGLVNMESSALLVIFLMIFLKWYFAVPITFIVVLSKSLFDKRGGSDKEFHDIICATIGIIIGVLLVMAMAL